MIIAGRRWRPAPRVAGNGQHGGSWTPSGEAGNAGRTVSNARAAKSARGTALEVGAGREPHVRWEKTNPLGDLSSLGAGRGHAVATTGAEGGQSAGGAMTDIALASQAARPRR